MLSKCQDKTLENLVKILDYGLKNALRLSERLIQCILRLVDRFSGHEKSKNRVFLKYTVKIKKNRKSVVWHERLTEPRVTIE